MINARATYAANIAVHVPKYRYIHLPGLSDSENPIVKRHKPKAMKTDPR